MQTAFDAMWAADLRSIRSKLTARFGNFRTEQRFDPVSQFVCSLLGVRTYDHISRGAFFRIVQRYRSWDAIADAPVSDIKTTLWDVTFPEKKAPHLKHALGTIRARFDRINLDFLADLEIDEALRQLEKIHGVGRKIAAATLNFSSLRKRAFVVDTHVLRVLRRLGFVGAHASTEETYNTVMAAADGYDADDLFELHWQLKRLGQTTCSHTDPQCVDCPLLSMCWTYVKPDLHTKTQTFTHVEPNHALRADRLSALRAFLAKPELRETSIRVPLGHREADACLKGGLQRGVPHEVFAVSGHEAAATGFAAGLTIRVAGDKRLLWIRQDFSAREFGDLSATGFLELGLDPSRLLLLSVAGATECLRAATDALSCAALGAVVIEISGQPKILDLTASRRLTLACVQKTVTAILLRFGAEPDASAAETRWLVRAVVAPAEEDDWPPPIFHAGLIRNRHGRTGNWLMEWCSDDGLFHNPAADIGAPLSAPADRQAATG